MSNTDEKQGPALGAGEHGWLRRQRAAQVKMIGDKARREEVRAIRRRMREEDEDRRRIELGEEPLHGRVSKEDVEHGSNVQQATLDRVEENEEAEQVVIQEGEESTEEAAPDEDLEEAAEEEEQEGPEEDEDLPEIMDMDRQEMIKELKRRDCPPKPKANVHALRAALETARESNPIVHSED